MKKNKQKPFDIILFWDVILMTVFGLIMIFSASSPSAFTQHGNSYYFVGKQLIWAVVGIGAMLICANIDFRIYKKWAVAIYIVNFLALVAVLAVGENYNGAKRWLNLGFSTVQPTEFTKIALVLCLAAYFELIKGVKQTFKNIYIGLGIIIAIPCGLIMLQPHFSAVIIICLTTFVMMVAYGIQLKFYLPALIVGVPAGIVLIKYEPYRLKRITAFLDPFKDKLGDGWQIVQSLYAIGSGGIFGLGLTRSRQKYLYIPEPQNDFIFSIICEELGILGAILVMFLFAVLIWRCVIIAVNCEDNFGMLVAFGLGMLTLVQVILNIGVATSTLPPTGVPLPFFSAGGTSYVFQAVSMGIILNISRYRKD